MATSTEAEVIVAGTDAFKKMEKDSRGRNRGPHPKVMKDLDPEGLHIVGYQMMHNDVEWRCMWLCKLRNQDEPVNIWMDNGFDAFADNTRTLVHEYDYTPDEQ